MATLAGAAPSQVGPSGALPPAIRRLITGGSGGAGNPLDPALINDDNFDNPPPPDINVDPPHPPAPIGPEPTGPIGINPPHPPIPITPGPVPGPAPVTPTPGPVTPMPVNPDMPGPEPDPVPDPPPDALPPVVGPPPPSAGVVRQIGGRGGSRSPSNVRSSLIRAGAGTPFAGGGESAGVGGGVGGGGLSGLSGASGDGGLSITGGNGNADDIIAQILASLSGGR